ncbi:MAG: hypothetical protein ACFFA0_13665 [Promethearchaeota archaeon]
MISISGLDSRELSLKYVLKKVYAKIFLVFVIAIIIASLITMFASMIPEPGFGDPGGDDYDYLMDWVAALTTFLQNIGIVLFSFAMFIGAITDRDLATQVRTGLAIAAGLALIALFI